jgi:His-Xaa-Ser system radical SAM maturase HxsC
MAPGPTSPALTGGEPTLLGDDLLVLLRACKQWLPNTDLMVLTNARRLKARDYVESIARVGHPRLTMAVPLYADVDFLHDEIVGARGAFRDTVEGLQNLALYGLEVEIRVVILSLNHRRLRRLAEFIYANLPFASHVAWMGMETTGLARQNLDRVWVDPFDYRDDLEVICRFLYRRMMPVSLYNLPLCILPKPLWSLARKSISEWKNVYFPECQSCAVKSDCCGFFASADIRRSDKLAPVGT